MTNIEINEVYKDLQCKNTELRKTITYLQAENSAHKEKYQGLKNRLATLTENVEKNVQIFKQLADDMKGILHMGSTSTLLSPIVTRKSLNRPVVLTSVKNVQESMASITGPSSLSDVNVPVRRNITRRKINIEPINMQKLSEETSTELQAAQNLSNHTPEATVEESSRLSTILEENTNFLREVSVKLERLPTDVVEMHLFKQNDTSMNSLLNFSIFSSQSRPSSSSTPSKLEIMQQLELVPIDRVPTFVTDRRRSRKCKSSTSQQSASPKWERLSSVSNMLENSIKKERLSSKLRLSDKTIKENLSPKATISHKNQETTKKQKNTKDNIKQSPKEITNGRSKRSARPTQLKEVSLRKKMRRS